MHPADVEERVGPPRFLIAKNRERVETGATSPTLMAVRQREVAAERAREDRGVKAPSASREVVAIVAAEDE
jgi:hypothetical protein